MVDVIATILLALCVLTSCGGEDHPEIHRLPCGCSFGDCTGLGNTCCRGVSFIYPCSMEEVRMCRAAFEDQRCTP